MQKRRSLLFGFLLGSCVGYFYGVGECIRMHISLMDPKADPVSALAAFHPPLFNSSDGLLTVAGALLGAFASWAITSTPHRLTHHKPLI
jgi:hypothetical protein